MERDAKRSSRVRIEVCPDCEAMEALSRREFLRTVGAAAAAAGALAPAGNLLARPLSLEAKSAKAEKPAETYVKLLYETLTPEQKKIMHFPFDHELRRKVSNNWHVVDRRAGAIGRLYNSDQKELIRSILKSITTEDGYERFMRQMKDDQGGFETYTCAIFGKPGDERFEWVLTGRHVTLRCDGNSVENVAFGGPIFYGHAVEFNEKPDHPGNVWWHQGKLANKLFQALDGKQRERALLAEAPPDSQETVRLRGKEGAIAGLPARELSGDQRGLLEECLRSLMSMFRKEDVDEVMECLKKNGGLEALTVSFYKEGDIGGDGVWDRWRVEGPAFVWYFRGSPHVHTWVHVAHNA